MDKLTWMVITFVVVFPFVLYLERKRNNAWKEAEELLKLTPEPLEKDMLHHLGGTYREFTVVVWHRVIYHGRSSENSTILGARLSSAIWRELILEPLGFGDRLKSKFSNSQEITIGDDEFDKRHRILGKVHEGTYKALHDGLVQVQFEGLRNSFSRYWMKDGVLFVEQNGEVRDPYKLVRMLDRLVDRARVLDRWADRNLLPKEGGEIAARDANKAYEEETTGVLW